MHQHFAPVRLLNKIIQHALGDFEVGDHAVFHGLDSHDVARRAAQHLLGFLAHRFHFAGVFIERYDRRLVDDDALALGEHQRVGRAQVNRQIG